MFNQQYNFTYNSGKRGYSAISKTANTKTVVSYKLIVKRQTTSYTNDVKSSVRGILKLEPRTILSQTSNVKSNVEAFAAVMYYAKPDLNIFDPYDKRLAILSNEGTDACPFWDAIYREELNKGGTFTFTVPANHEDSKFVVAENKVAFRDKDDNLRLFVIKETEEIDGSDGPIIEVYCDPEYIDELNDIVIEDKRPQDRTAEYALGQVLEESRWQVGEVAELGKNTTNFYFMTGIEAINRILDVWGGEIRDRIEVSGNQITGRYIDILTRRGSDTGKRWEIDKDIIEITRLTQSYPKTALYGRGASLETEGGGFSRLLTFEDVEWSVANGDPVDKPLGQKWVGDPDALYKYGRRKTDVEPIAGTTPRVYSEQDKYDASHAYLHRFGIYENGNIEDPEELLWATWNELQEQKRPFENYTLDVLLYAEKAGLDHEKVRLGDTSIALDRRFARPIEVEERIIAYEYDVANPDDTGKVELGQFRELFSDEKRLDKIQSQLDNAQGKANHPEIDDDSFPDVKPETPTNFTAEGLFKVIQLKWDFVASSYIAAYELYASQTPNFNPTPETLVWRGKTGGYAFEADTDEQWYFRLRAVNTHGTASDFTSEISAQTIKINAGIDVAPYTITDQLIAQDANIDFAKIANVEITDAMITNLSGDKIDAGTISGVAFEQVGESGVLRADSDGLKIYDKENDLRAAILIGGTEGVDNVLGLTLLDDGESVFEINQDGNQAMIDSKIDLVLNTDKGFTITSGSDILFDIDTTFDPILSLPSTLMLYDGRSIGTSGQQSFSITSADLGNQTRVHLTPYFNGNLVNWITSTLSGDSTDDLSTIIFGRVLIFDIEENTRPSNLQISQNGQIMRTSSSERYKLAVEDLRVDPYKLLRLNPKSWYDKNNTEKYASLLHKEHKGEDVEFDCDRVERIPGLIAEDVKDAELDMFVDYGLNGEVEGIMYDRLWTLLIPIVRDLKERIDEIESKCKCGR